MQVNGELHTEDRARALAEIENGNMLLHAEMYKPWDIQRILGRLYYLIGDYEGAVPHLVDAKQNLRGASRVANDRMLIEAYAATGEREKARKIVMHGVQYGGQNASAYEEFVDLVNSRE